MIKRETDNCILLGVHSWNDFCERAAQRLTCGPMPGAEKAGTETGEYRTGWTGTRDLQHALDMARDGWQDGAQAIGKALDSLPPGVEALPDWQLDGPGAFPCIPAFLSGEPECMWKLEDNRRTAHRLSLLVPHSYSAGVSTNQAMQYAKAIAALVRSIEASGIDVAVYSVSSGQNGYTDQKKDCLYAVVVREFGEPLDLAKIAFAFHPSMLRRLGFCWREATKDAAECGLAREGYASPQRLTHAKCAELLGDVGVMVITEGISEVSRLCDGDSNLPALIDRLRIGVDKAIKELT